MTQLDLLSLHREAALEIMHHTAITASQRADELEIAYKHLICAAIMNNEISYIELAHIFRDRFNIKENNETNNHIPNRQWMAGGYCS